jgi:hypothetical protein
MGGDKDKIRLFTSRLRTTTRTVPNTTPMATRLSRIFLNFTIASPSGGKIYNKFYYDGYPCPTKSRSYASRNKRICFDNVRIDIDDRKVYRRYWRGRSQRHGMWTRVRVWLEVR